MHLSTLTQMQIPKDVEDIIETLNQHGFEAYAVGGCVRDTLLGRIPEDWDITTSAMPMEVKSIFKRTIDTGIQHGTVTVLQNKVGYEVTTYRIDGEYEDARHPKKVEFTSNLLEDLKRRDFTINAMAYSHRTGIVDAFGGQEDLSKKVIRCVGEARERFTEDALRILRAVRFAGQLGFEIEEETYCAIREIAPNLQHISKERILTELTKIVLSEHPERLMDVWKTGMAPYIAKDFSLVFEACENDREKSLLCRLTRLPQLKREKYLRFSAVFCGIESKKVETILKELKSDNDTWKKASVIVTACAEDYCLDKSKIRRKMNQIGSALFLDSLSVKAILPNGPMDDMIEADKWQTEKQLAEEILLDGDCLSLKDLAVCGGDLIQMGIKPGKEMGNLLNALLQYVLVYPKKNQKEYLMDLVQSREGEILKWEWENEMK